MVWSYIHLWHIFKTDKNILSRFTKKNLYNQCRILLQLLYWFSGIYPSLSLTVCSIAGAGNLCSTGQIWPARQKLIDFHRAQPWRGSLLPCFPLWGMVEPSAWTHSQSAVCHEANSSTITHMACGKPLKRLHHPSLAPCSCFRVLGNPENDDVTMI